MRIHIGGDHAAYDLHRALVTHLTERGHDVVDHGPKSYDAEDDYPVYVLRAAVAVAADEGSLGVVLGGSGNGEQIAANKVKGIRAALAWSAELAGLAREHNNAQIVSIGARFTEVDVAKAIVDTFVSTEFTDQARHQPPARYGDRVRRHGGLADAARPKHGLTRGVPGPVPPRASREARGHQREPRLSAPALPDRSGPSSSLRRAVAEPCPLGHRQPLPAPRRRGDARDRDLAAAGALDDLHPPRRGGRALPRASPAARRLRRTLHRHGGARVVARPDQARDARCPDRDAGDDGCS